MTFYKNKIFNNENFANFYWLGKRSVVRETIVTQRNCKASDPSILYNFHLKRFFVFLIVTEIIEYRYSNGHTVRMCVSASSIIVFAERVYEFMGYVDITYTTYTYVYTSIVLKEITN